MKYKFTDKEIKEILKNLTIIVDTREKANDHIIEWFKANKIPYKIQKLDYGDYGGYLPIGSFKGQQRDIYFTDDIVIERKACIDELVMNFKAKKENINALNKEIIEVLGKSYLEKILRNDYVRLKTEFANLNKYNIRFFIFMEDHLFDKHIRNKNYRSAYDPVKLYKRIKSLEPEFNTILRPISKEFIASEIYSTISRNVRNILVHKGFIERVK